MVLQNNQKPSSVAKKPRIARTFYCPNPRCQKGFDTPKQFKLHIGLITFACNETKLSSIGKTSCWPLMFTTTILNQEMRNKSIEWRQLG